MIEQALGRIRLVPPAGVPVPVEITTSLSVPEAVGGLSLAVAERRSVPTRTHGTGYTQLNGSIWGEEVYLTFDFSLVRGTATRQFPFQFAGTIRATGDGSALVGQVTREASLPIRYLPSVCLAIGLVLLLALSPASVILLLASWMFYRLATSQVVVRDWHRAQFAEAIARVFSDATRLPRESSSVTASH